MDSGSTSLIPHAASARTRSAGWCSWLLLICIAASAGCDSRAAVEEHTKETIRLLAEAKQRADVIGSEPKDIPELQRWLREYEPLVRRLAVVEAQLEAVLLRATPKLDGNLKIKGYDFASEAEEKQAQALMDLRRYLQDFGGVSASSNGLCGLVKARLLLAEKLARDAITAADKAERAAMVAAETGAAAATTYRAAVEANPQAWPAAIDAIAKSDRYGGMKLREHEGLLPIGVDPESKLWEFVHIASGTPGKAIPARDPATGRIVPDGDMGIVLVLLPGGTFWMGAQKDDLNKPNYDPQAQSDEGPVHQVTLSPFFVGKYEVTQGQWLRWTGSNPSLNQRSDELAIPITNVSWHHVDAVMRVVNLMLPTEAQWEYACRGGTASPWWTGSSEEQVGRAESIGDASTQEVGSKIANHFGLFDTQGNVWEWCRDSHGTYSRSAVRDPYVSLAEHRVVRGGSVTHFASDCRSARRGMVVPDGSNDHLGFRVGLAPVLVQ
jgi:formylglycine-generating enzyme required for sulfatase activity